MLLKVGFEYWNVSDDKTYKGIPIEKDFERFRKDIAIIAGYYYAVYDIKGNVRLKAKSISFLKMDENEFRDLYSKTIDVFLKNILQQYTPGEIDRAVCARIDKKAQEILDFDR